MKRKTIQIRLTVTAICLIILMLNTDTASLGAQEGLTQCIQTIIPSLFPFFLLTTYLTPMLWTISPHIIRKLCNYLAIPKGCEGILMLGLVGGYPVGAQSVSTAYRGGKISKQQAQILMGYCNNAGPAFIFGVTGKLFPASVAPWFLWLIHILSALLTGLVLPKAFSENIETENTDTFTFTQAFHKSLWITASVCGWIIIFKVIFAMLTVHLPTVFTPCLVYLSGFLELSGGCISLSGITSYPLRFVLCSVFLSFGGICVLMQTASVASNLGLGLYLPGKLIQTGFSIIFSLLFIILEHKSLLPAAVFCIITALCAVIIYILACFCRKKYGNNSTYDV